MDEGSGYQNDGKNSQPNGYRIKLGYGDQQWRLNLNGQSAAGRDRDHFVNRGYWVWNFAAHYKLSDQASVYFNANNLADKAYEINGRSDLSAVKGNYPMLSRNFQLGVRYSF
ncbi:TonB-dependent receptor|nr:TonB-dependent receptor [Dendrosporobacter quercicolus DSM 1736]